MSGGLRCPYCGADHDAAAYKVTDELALPIIAAVVGEVAWGVPDDALSPEVRERRGDAAALAAKADSARSLDDLSAGELELAEQCLWDLLDGGLHTFEFETRTNYYPLQADAILRHLRERRP